jgi:uncharacterized protein involved in response to NO
MTSSPRSPTLAERIASEPFRLFFPLAFLLGALGVGQWIGFVAGAHRRYLGLFHAITMTQAFLLAFAAGFLMTAIPKRTRSAPARWLEIGPLAVLLMVVCWAALFERYATAELAYAGAVVILGSFAIRRLVGSTAARRPPASFGLIPVGLVAGLAGSFLFAWGTRDGASAFTFELGRRLVFEGVFTLLTLGVGAFLLPLALRGEAAPDVSGPRPFAGYVAAGLLILATYAAGAAGAPRASSLLRGAVVAAVLLGSGALRWPTRPGANRRLVWLAAVALPVGPLLAGIFPDHAVAAMHVTFIGGFGLLAFAVATHVTLAHGGFDALQARRPWPVLAFGAAFLVAATARASATIAPNLYLVMLGIAASAWCVGAIIWLSFLMGKLRSASDEDAAARMGRT